jgi:aspartate/methionine/tyrosine aminotransferase
MQTILKKSDSVLVLTPCWPILPGIIRSAEAEIIEVPFYMDLYHGKKFSISRRLQEYLQSNTCALYVNSLNNPSGKVLNRNQLTQIARFAGENRLWLISDEAYDGLTFDGHKHICIATLAGVFEQTISVFTFSKIFMFAGLRLGYAVAPSHVINLLNKTMVHQIYSPPTVNQMMMIDPVRSRHEWMSEVRDRYQYLRDIFISGLDFRVDTPESAYFIFFDVSGFLSNISYDDLILKIFREGVSVAPGSDFGHDFTNYIRICFTGENPERISKAVNRLNRIFAGLKDDLT